MANISITNLPAVLSVTGTDALPIVQTGTSYRVTLNQIAAYTQSVYPPPGITTVNTTAPILGGPFTTSGTVSLQANGVTNAYLGTMPTLTLKGNNTGSTATPVDLTVADTMTMLGAAPLASPTFTGSPLAPTPSSSDSSTRLATTAYVKAQGYGTGSVTSVTAGSGLSGGTITTSGTISLPITGVTASTYGTSSAVGTFTVDAYGRITSASNTNISVSAIGAVPTSRTISTSGGISGGGDLTADRTLTLTPIANNTLLANTSGSSASASQTTLTALMDATLGNQQGNILYRSGTVWTALTPGAADQVLATGGAGANPFWKSVAGTGTVTSVNASGGTTGLTFSGGPITSSGTLTVAGTLIAANGGTGLTATPSNGQLLIGNGSGYTLGTLTAGTGIGVSNSSGGITLTNTGVTSFSAGTTGLTPNTGTTGAVTLAGTLVSANGGTGFSTYAAGDIIYASATNTLSKLAAGTNGYVLTLSGGVPTWAASTGGVTSISFGSTGLTPSTTSTGAITVAGTLAIGSGGTGQTTASAAFNALSPITSVGDLIIGAGVNTASRLAIGANGYVLTSNGTTASWQAATASGSTTTRTTFTATAGQTSFTVTYDPTGVIVVTRNGSVLTPVTDYTATSGTAVVLTDAAFAGDNIVVLAINPATSASGVTAFSAGTTGLTPSTSTGGSITLGGTLAIANGGTGQTTASAALNALGGVSTGKAIAMAIVFGG
jgi:hypothetical protein